MIDFTSLRELAAPRSVAELVSQSTPAYQAWFTANLSREQKNDLAFAWRFWARPKQLPPPGDWATWLLRAGRGFGKTRAGAGWAHERAMAWPRRWIALVAKNPADARDYMIEGPGGILRNTAPRERPLYEPSKRRITWNNGSWATVFSDEEPDQTRGFSGDTAWLDEPAKYDHLKEVLDNLDFGMRESSDDRPRKILTTTPQPVLALMLLEKLASTKLTTGDSYENRGNLDATWFSETILKHEGTRFGRQEIHAEYLTDTPGALWTQAMIEKCKHLNGMKIEKAPELRRIVVAIDPSGSDGEAPVGSQIGIVGAGVDYSGMGWIVKDRTCQLSPAGWGRVAVTLYHELKADRIVAEKNFGGAMVEHVIRTVDPSIPVRLVTASRGKVQRAEPVSALYEKDQVKHVPGLEALEDQYCLFNSEGYMGDGSPDRADAAIWALSDLMLGRIQYEPGYGMAGPRLVTVDD